MSSTQLVEQDFSVPVTPIHMSCLPFCAYSYMCTCTRRSTQVTLSRVDLES
jgi:hypothetical protein